MRNGLQTGRPGSMSRTADQRSLLLMAMSMAAWMCISLAARICSGAQQHLLILSGLHGLLRPMDRLQPYRLEMGTALRNERGANLYDFWGAELAESINALVSTHLAPIIVNLASNEYIKAIDQPHALTARVLHCAFEDWKDGQYKVISFFAKRARGLMARYAIENRVVTPEGLQAFRSEGYRFAPESSSVERLVFRRKRREATARKANSTRSKSAT